MLSLLYRKLVPETIRTQIRNLQYIFHDFLFCIKKAFNPKTNPKKTFKKSVCYIIPTTNITGGVAVVCEHLNRLQKIGYKCLIASTDNKTDLSWFPNQAVKVIPLSNNRESIEKYHTVVATGWITAYELLLLNVKRKIYFVQSDETRFYPMGSYLKHRVKKTYFFPFEFMTEAKWIQAWLKKEFNKNSFYVPNGINTKIFYPDTPLEPKLKNKKRVLLEGAINLPFKNMALAFSVVKGLDCEVWCVSYDGHPDPSWHCDRFFEKVPMQKMRQIYSSCDILLKLSTVEGFFGPPLEMMACGGIPLVLKVTGYDEYIINNYNALVTESANIQSIQEKLKILLNNKVAYSNLLTNAQKTVKNMTWNKSIKLLTSIYGSK